MHTWIRLLLVGFCTTAAARADDLGQTLEQLKAVGPAGGANREAAVAWKRLSQSDASVLPQVLVALDDANPLAANWIRTAIDAAVERSRNRGQALPVRALEQFLADTKHRPAARRLAYELIVAADPAAEARLLPGMTNDPSLELRRDAIARQIVRADGLVATDRAGAIALWQQSLMAARDFDQARVLAERLGKQKVAVDLPRHFGYLVQWQVIGPFDNKDGKGFDAVYPPEQKVDFAAVHRGKHGEVRWKPWTATGDPRALDFNKALKEEKAVVAYAAAVFHTRARQEIELRLSSVNATRVWLNARPIGEFPVYHSGSQPDQYVASAILEPGANVILVKSCQNEQTQDWARVWGFQLRVCDALGGGILSADRE